MCNFKSWHFDDHACNIYQVTFGTTMLILDKNNFETFIELVTARCETLVPIDDKLKYIVLPTPGNIVHIVLTEKELMHLHCMLQNADTEIKSQQILALFDDKGLES
ncbi:hypothetical protein [Pinibacter soli]|uniref:Uncharacterized protein n=1 Tax=Pinibacter soli TaxID=3044211 RepID=A0ABT6REJ8_9BACT|nr:hypothetical protein [Pinibacter soli]MDI3320820.1 hypothetical protein [Pinibacter soli]